MKKLLALIGLLYCLQISLFSSDRAPRPLPDRTPTPQVIKEAPSGGICRIFASCCCIPSTVDLFIEDATILYNILNFLAGFTPNYIRQVYLLCQNGVFILSSAVTAQLNRLGLLDDQGNIREGWKDMILTMLTHPSTEIILPAKTYYFQQSVLDLKEQYPTLVETLEKNAAAESEELSATELSILYKQYKLIHSLEKITTDEITRILAVLHPSEEGIYRDPFSQKEIKITHLILRDFKEFINLTQAGNIQEHSLAIKQSSQTKRGDLADYYPRAPLEIASK